MKKCTLKFYLFSILIFVLAGCILSSPKMQATPIKQTQTARIIVPTSTYLSPLPSVTPTQTVSVENHSSQTPTPTITPINTLEPEKVNEMIKILLRVPVDCPAPCFWGIVPGETTTEETVNIFSHLGIQTVVVSYQGKDFYNANYDFDNGLSLSVNLPTSNNLVESITLTLVPDPQKTGITREWSAYSPDVLISRYGTPSRVDFVADWGPGSFFAMQIYFDSLDLVVQYSGDNIIPSQKGESQVCPLTVSFNGIRLWMGKNPSNPPSKGFPLEIVTSLTLDEFSTLLIGDPNQACFTFDGNAIE